MSQHRTSRTALLRRGLVALATATTLLAGGLVVAPSAQAVPVVDLDSRGGTVVKTRMDAWGSVIEGDVTTDKLSAAKVRYEIDLDWSGGKLSVSDFDGVVTLQRVGAKQVRQFPVTVDRDGKRSGTIKLPGTLTPGSYRVGIEFTARVKRPDGRSMWHRVDVNNAETVSVRRETVLDASITNPRATDGRSSRITGRVRALSVSADGDVYWSTLRSGTVQLSYYPGGLFRNEAEPVSVRPLTIDRHGKFTTVVPARDRIWVLDYAGTKQLNPDGRFVVQGPERSCGC
ncbi:hypothetical protein ACIGB8_12445 [Promicromonospora sukumoe]|uniref:hypothetical protein n=1 Tax=Promicromonospora sukumoe TaxID=88382 RepID=UPI0037C904DA